MAEATVTVPRERIGVLIGRRGEVKRRIEGELDVSLTVDGEAGNVEVVGKEGGDPLNILKAKSILTAIGRGFSPPKALKLLDEENILDTIDLRELFGKNEAQIQRLKGRVIGRDGKARRMIEELTRTDLSVYGHTISMIGSYDRVAIAREAVEMLLKGKQHSTVYRFLRGKVAEVKRREKTELWMRQGKVGTVGLQPKD